jgi:hypothetical protein
MFLLSFTQWFELLFYDRLRILLRQLPTNLLRPYGAEFELGDVAVGIQLVDGQQIGCRLAEVKGKKDTAA